MEIVQKKRTHKISIPLLPVTLEILEKYNFQVPKIRENTMLKYIKEAGQKAGITDKHIVTEDRGSKITNTTYYKYELIGTHTGRRSFISNMLKCGYDGHILMKITGHKTEASFKKYAKLSSEDAANVILDTEANKAQTKGTVQQEIDSSNYAYQFGKAFSKLEQEHREDIDKLSFSKEVDKASSLIDSGIDTVDFLINNGMNECDVIKFMKHKGILSDDADVTYDADGKASIRFKKV